MADEKDYEVTVKINGYPAPSGYGMGSLIAESGAEGLTEEQSGELYDRLRNVVDQFCNEYNIT